MPLKKGHSTRTISANISELLEAGYQRDQAIAIALHEAGKSKAKTPKKSK